MSNHKITIQATAHTSAPEAIEYLDVSGDDHAILLRGRYLTVTDTEVQKILRAGIEFAYLVERDGKIMTIPVAAR